MSKVRKRDAVAEALSISLTFSDDKAKTTVSAVAEAVVVAQYTCLDAGRNKIVTLMFCFQMSQICLILFELFS